MGIKKCIIPVAGLGSRFLPISSVFPKELMPVKGLPILQHGVKETIDAGLKDISIIVSPGKEIIKNYFSPEKNKTLTDRNLLKHKSIQDLIFLMNQVKLNYVTQHQPRGLGHAISLMQNYLKEDESFAVILPDDLCSYEDLNLLSEMVKLSEEFRGFCILAVEKIPKNMTNQYGIVDLGDEIHKNSHLSIYNVKDIVEKPASEEAPSDFGVIGRYILPNDIFNKISSKQLGYNNEIQITDAIKHYATEGRLIAITSTVRRFDCGTLQGYSDAVTNF